MPRSFVSLAIIACIVAGWWRSTFAPFDEAPFNSSLWRSAHTESQRERRARMTGDLLRRLKAGTPDRKITALLGEPDRTWPQEKGHDQLEYDMGYAPGSFAGEYIKLRLNFDMAGRFLSSEITRD